MATEEKKYIINFEDNLNVYAQRAVDAKKAVDALKLSNEEYKKAQDELLTSGKLNEKQIAETTVEIEKRNAALKTAEKEYSNAKKQTELATAANKAEAGSYDELYKRWQLAQVELKKLGDTVPKNAQDAYVLSERFKEQSKSVDEAKRALNQFGKETSDNRLNVGNYSEAIEGAIGGFAGLPGPVGNAASAISGAGKTFKELSKTILSTPIGWILAGVASLIAIFAGFIKIIKSTDSGATEFAVRMEQIRAIIDVLRVRTLALITTFKDFFTGNWKKLGEDVKNTFGGIGDQMNSATAAARKYQEALDDIEDRENNYVSNAADNKNKIAKLEYTAQDRTKTTEERKKALDEAIALGEEETKMQVKFAEDKLNNEIDYLAGKAGLRREDVLGFIKMTDEEQKTANESLQTLRNNNDEKFKIIEGLYSDAIEADTKFYEENKRNQSKSTAFSEELRQKEIDRINGLATIHELENKILSDHNKTLLTKLKADYDKRLQTEGTSYEQREKLLKEYLKKVAEIEASEAAQAKQILKEKLNADLKDTKLTDTQKLVLKQQYKEAVNAIDEEESRKAIEGDATERKRVLSEQQAEIKAGIEYQKLKADNLKKQGGDNLELLKGILDAEFEAMKTSGAYDELGPNQKLLADQKYLEAKQSLDDEAILKKEETVNQDIALDKLLAEEKTLTGQNTINEQEAILDAEYQAMSRSLEYSQMTASQQRLIDQKYTNDKKAFSNARIAQSEKELNIVGNALGTLSDIVGKETVAGKAFAVAQATINTWLAASQALRDPTMPSTFAKIAAMVAIIGSGLMTVRNIMKVDTTGKSSSGSTSGAVSSGVGTAAVERVAATAVQPQTNNVMNKQATTLASSPQITQMAQTKGVNILNPTTPNVVVNVPAQKTLTTEDLTKAFKSLPSPVVTVEDINARSYEVNKIAVRANI